MSKVERSSDQVIKPVNLEALTKWVGHFPGKKRLPLYILRCTLNNFTDDVVKDMADIAPMLSVLDYDPYANPPNYGKFF